MIPIDLNQAQQHLQLAEKHIDMDQPSMERGYLHNLMEFHLLKGNRSEAKKRLQQMSSFPIFRSPIFSATLLKYQFYPVREKNFVHELLTLIDKKTDPTSLSNRELEVLQVMVTGTTNREIAERLCISVATVKTHIIHIYTKLHVSNRMEAIEKARSMELFSLAFHKKGKGPNGWTLSFYFSPLFRPSDGGILTGSLRSGR